MKHSGAVVSLLRAINVGNRQVTKDRLVAIHEAAGCLKARTYLASGNVVFLAADADLATLALDIEQAFLRETGLGTQAILRSADDLERVLARNPFADEEPSRVLVTFFGSSPAQSQIEDAMAIPVFPEQMMILGSEMYVFYPSGLGRSRFPDAKISRALGGVPATARNINTVSGLVKVAASLDRSV